MEPKDFIPDDNKSNNKLEFWIRYSPIYISVVEFSMMQLASLLYSQTRCWEASRILDAGAGSGRPSRMFVASYMKPGAHYYNTDFSPKMLELFENGFNASGMCEGDTIKLNPLEKADFHTVQAYNPADKTKNIYYGYGDNLNLPFEDASFERYISNSTLNFVDDPAKMIKEAYRVLEDGGICGLSMVGDMTDAKMMPTIINLMIENKIENKATPNKINLNNKDVIRKLFEDAGFKSIKIFTHKIYCCGTPEESLNLLSNFDPISSFLRDSPEDVAKNFKDTYKAAHDELFGDNSNDLDDGEFYIMLAKK